MALSFPLPRETFFDLLPVARITFDCPEQIESSRTGAGEVLSADLVARLWSGGVTLGRLTRAETPPLLALLNALRSAGASFMAYDVAHAAPAADPSGAILGAAAPVIASLLAGNRELTISGLPAGYVLSPGDYLAFGYGSDPLRQALHQVVVGSTADGTGLSGNIELTPHIRPGAQVGAAITLIRPYCKALLVPGSVDPGRRDGAVTEGIGFRFQQTLR
jgi:hypothetical protein